MDYHGIVSFKSRCVTKRNLIGTLAAILGFLAAPVYHALARPWTDSSGTRTIEAEFVEFKNGTVVLKKTDGKTLKLPLAKLSTADQDFVRSQPAATAAKDTADPTSGSEGTATKSAKSAPSFKVQLLGLHIERPVPTERKKSRGNDSLLSFGPFGKIGTHIRLLVVENSLEVIGLDTKASKITSITDDHKTNLAGQDEFSYGALGPIRFFKTDEDSKFTIVEIFQPGMPAPGATKIRLEGQLVLSCGAGEKPVEQKDFLIAPGSKVKVGPVPLEIVDTQDRDSGETRFVVTFKSNKPLDAIKRIEFLEDGGQPIKTREIRRDKSEFTNNWSYSRTVGLSQRLDSGIIRVTQYDKTERVTLPLALEIGIGL